MRIEVDAYGDLYVSSYEGAFYVDIEGVIKAYTEAGYNIVIEKAVKFKEEND